MKSMINKFILKGFSICLWVVGLLISSASMYAQGGMIPTPPKKPMGATNPGEPDNPIDMYQFILLAIAMFMIIYFHYRNRSIKKENI